MGTLVYCKACRVVIEVWGSHVANVAEVMGLLRIRCPNCGAVKIKKSKEHLFGSFYWSSSDSPETLDNWGFARVVAMKNKLYMHPDCEKKIEKYRGNRLSQLDAQVVYTVYADAIENGTAGEKTVAQIKYGF